MLAPFLLDRRLALNDQVETALVVSGLHAREAEGAERGLEGEFEDAQWPALAVAAGVRPLALGRHADLHGNELAIFEHRQRTPAPGALAAVVKPLRRLSQASGQALDEDGLAVVLFLLDELHDVAPEPGRELCALRGHRQRQHGKGAGVVGRRQATQQPVRRLGIARGDQAAHVREHGNYVGRECCRQGRSVGGSACPLGHDRRVEGRHQRRRG